MRRSTKETDRRKALRVAELFEIMARKKTKRRALHKAFNDLYRDLYGEGSLPHATVREYALSCLAAKKLDLKPNSLEIYRQGINKLLGFLGQAADRDIADIEPGQLAAYRIELVKTNAAETVNTRLQLVRSLFRSAVRDALIVEDPSTSIKAIKSSPDDVRRRPFTVAEIKRILAVADPEWQSLIKFGLYTGQRLGDLARLSWGNIDMGRGVICLRASKADKHVTIPACASLKAHIVSLPMPREPSGPIHPRAHRIIVTQKSPTSLCIQFGRILERAGLRENGTTPVGRRRNHELSFHCLRHSFVSLLKDAGASDAAVMELAGLSSREMSERYTHTGLDTLERAVRLLPEVGS